MLEDDLNSIAGSVYNRSISAIANAPVKTETCISNGFQGHASRSEEILTKKSCGKVAEPILLGADGHCLQATPTAQKAGKLLYL
jgi:hypothetical protein